MPGYVTDASTQLHKELKGKNLICSESDVSTVMGLADS
jgi:hypothetical protein